MEPNFQQPRCVGIAKVIMWSGPSGLTVYPRFVTFMVCGVHLPTEFCSSCAVFRNTDLTSPLALAGVGCDYGVGVQ